MTVPPATSTGGTAPLVTAQLRVGVSQMTQVRGQFAGRFQRGVQEGPG